MTAELGANSYGKSGIHLVKVVRENGRHDLIDVMVAVKLEGQFERAHTAGDNADVLPTDTMKNTVFALARTHRWQHPEEFGRILCDHFIGASPKANRVSVELRQALWSRLNTKGGQHPTAFQLGGTEHRIARVARDRSAGVTVSGGLEGLTILRSAGSAFSGYPRDAYTTLPETRDRILATSLTAEWRYAAGGKEGAAWEAIRQSLVDAFVDHDSESVQHTLWRMGQAAIDANRAIDEIRLTMPNKHHLVVDLKPFGMDNPNEIFVATTEPFGLIEAVVKRAISY